LIQTAAQLHQSILQLGRMYDALATLRERTGGQGQFHVLAEGPLDEIRVLEQSIAEYSGRREAEDSAAQVWIRITGPDIAWPEAPTSVVTNFLDTFRRGVQACTEWLESGHLSTRPTAGILRASDLRVVGMQAGSLIIGVRLPEPDHDASTIRVNEALSTYLRVAAWAGSEEDADDLEDAVPDPALRRTILTYVKQLAPRPRGGVETVELYGRAMPGRQRVALTRAAHSRIDEAIHISVNETVEEHVGEVREIDLDNMTFRLTSNDGTYINCRFTPDQYPTASQALDRRVRLSGSRRREGGRSRPSLTVAWLVIEDEGMQEDDEGDVESG
jgi:hypothetical protein